MNRRQLLAAGLAAGAVSTARAADDGRKPCLRAAHVTDIHITKDRDSPKGVAALFAHMFGQKGWTPELVINSGDTCMALDGKTAGAKAAEQIDLWKAAVKGIKVPIRSCLGNHDVWNGDEPTDAIPATKKGFALMTEVMGMPAPYYSFDQGGWHFVALNSVCNWPKYGDLSKEHFDWLRADLKQTPKETPVCVFSHLPDRQRDEQPVRERAEEGRRRAHPEGVAAHRLLGAQRGVPPAPEREAVPERAHAHVGTGASTGASGTSAVGPAAGRGGTGPSTASRRATGPSTSSRTAGSSTVSSITGGRRTLGGVRS